MTWRLQSRAALLFGLPEESVTVTWDAPQRLYLVHVPEGSKPRSPFDLGRRAGWARLAEIPMAAGWMVLFAHPDPTPALTWKWAQETLAADVRPDAVVWLDDGFMARLDAMAEASARETAGRLPSRDTEEIYLELHRRGWAAKKALRVATEREFRILERAGGWAALDHARRERRGLELEVARCDALAADLGRLLPPEPLRFIVPSPPGSPCSSLT